MKRIVLLIMLCACWVDDDIVMAQCVVNSGTPTYSDGTYLSAAVCDANGAVKTSGGGGGTQYGEDTAHVSGDSVTMAGVVQQSADAALAGDGDRAVLQVDANGYLKVNVKAGAGGGVSVTEDAAHANGESVVPVACRRIDTAATSAGTSGDWATVDCDASGRLRTDTEMPDAAALADNTANPTVPGIAAYLMCYDGSTWDRCQGGINFVYTEDNAHTTADTGAMVLTKRTDTAASSAGTDGDYATLNTDASGRVWVNTGTIGIEDAAETAGGNLTMVGAVQRNTAASSAGATGDNATVNVDTLGLLWTRQLDPCSGVAKTYYPVNISTATTAEIVNGAGASNHVYICSVVLHTDAANDVAFVEDDTDACASPGTGGAGIFGGTTTGAGFQLAASSGLAIGGGGNSIARTATTNMYVCLITSAATQLTGHIAYVIAP